MLFNGHFLGFCTVKVWVDVSEKCAAFIFIVTESDNVGCQSNCGEGICCLCRKCREEFCRSELSVSVAVLLQATVIMSLHNMSSDMVSLQEGISGPRSPSCHNRVHTPAQQSDMPPYHWLRHHRRAPKTIRIALVKNWETPWIWFLREPKHVGSVYCDLILILILIRVDATSALVGF
jgi:hypothetical protein